MDSDDESFERIIELELVPRHVVRLKRRDGESAINFIARYWCDSEVIRQANQDLEKALFRKEKDDEA